MTAGVLAGCEVASARLAVHGVTWTIPVAGLIVVAIAAIAVLWLVAR